MPYGEIVVRTKQVVIISQRRQEIVQLIADDYSRKEIATKLKISIKTVQDHCNELRKSLGIKHYNAVIAELFRRGIIK